MRRLLATIAVLGVLASGCSTRDITPTDAAPAGSVSVEDSADDSTTVAPTTSSTTTTAPASTAAPTTNAPTTVAPTTVAPTTAAPTTAAPTTTVPQYVGAVKEISADLAAAMDQISFREGCPVGLDDLRLVEITYVNYGGQILPGEVIVHRDHADGVAQVFEELFDARFPMQSVDLIDVHGGSDQASMQANNTSGFNCREVAYSPGVWSNHAFGTAIDINPRVNPFVRGDFVDPESGREFVDRTAGDPGLIRDGDVVVEAFAKIGWGWGGHWTSSKDYQHFSADGN